MGTRTMRMTMAIKMMRMMRMVRILKMVGVPSVLLKFVQTINDEYGPIEEIRKKYAPNVYALYGAINTLHVVTGLLSKVGQDSSAAAQIGEGGFEGRRRRKGEGGPRGRPRGKEAAHHSAGA